MAVTLTGCVDFPSGEVSIDDNVCHWKGCMIFSGIHAGQVALSPGTAKCPDTYYGCVDFATGTFEVIVPESCCPCRTIGCCGCWGCENTTIKPDEMYITFSGIEDCDDKPGSSLNGDHILLLVDTPLGIMGCDCFEQQGNCSFLKQADGLFIVVTMDLDGDVTVSGLTEEPENPGSFDTAFRYSINQAPPDYQAGCVNFKSGSGDNVFISCTPGSGASGFNGSTTWSTTETEALCDG